MSNPVSASALSNQLAITAHNSGKILAGHESQLGNVNAPNNPAINAEIQYFKERLSPYKLDIAAIKAGASEVAYEWTSIVVECIKSATTGGCVQPK